MGDRVIPDHEHLVAVAVRSRGKRRDTEIVKCGREAVRHRQIGRLEPPEVGRRRWSVNGTPGAGNGKQEGNDGGGNLMFESGDI